MSVSVQRSKETIGEMEAMERCGSWLKLAGLIVEATSLRKNYLYNEYSVVS